MKSKSMSTAWTKKTETHETFITADQFDDFTKAGYVVFMTAPTAFGTYKAVKIDVVDRHWKPTRTDVATLRSSPKFK